jgi:glycosyltransferase involved in cell wall biosynthesis
MLNTGRMPSVNDTIKRPRVAIVTYPFKDNTGKVLLDSFVSLVVSLASELVVITGQFESSYLGVEVQSIGTRTWRRSTGISNILEQILLQFEVTARLLKLRRRIDIVLFFIGSGFTLPILMTFLLGKRSIVVMTGMGSRKQVRAVVDAYGLKGFSKIVRLVLSEMLERTSYLVADTLIVYGQSIISQTHLANFRYKTIVAPSHHLDLGVFNVSVEFPDRKNRIGYLGRLSEEKGVLNFLEAAEELSSDKRKFEFTIAGDGDLDERIREFIRQRNLSDRVRLQGWIQHGKLPEHLNQLKLVVIPSYTEGLPGVMLEAMACGTPVLANGVGAIPDILKDGKTGFIMSDNSPKSIAYNILRAFNHPEFDGIGGRARLFIEDNFTILRIRRIWEGILLGEKGSEVE